MIPDLCQTIENKVDVLASTMPTPDPAIAPWARQIAATVRRVEAFEGVLIAQVIPNVLARAPHLNVAVQPRVTLPQRALEAVEQGVTDVALEYTEDDGPVRQLDFTCFNQNTGILEFGESKRGLRQIGADHQRSRLKDDATLELIGRSYARKTLRQVAIGCRALTISYYGNTGLPENRTIRAAELDVHYGWPVREEVEEHLSYFRACLNEAIPGLTGRA